MREIKFRAWEEDVEFMNYSVCITTTENKSYYEVSEGFGLIEVNPEHVMQFTGLKDENSAEIYEGDVIEWLDPFGVTVRSQVIYDETTASYKTYKGELSHISIRPNLKVVGNIYENPELLEKEQTK